MSERRKHLHEVLCHMGGGECKMTSCITENVFSSVPKFKLLFPTEEEKLRTQFPSLLSAWIKDAMQQETKIKREKL